MSANLGTASSGPGHCPGPEAIAAFIDGCLGRAERRRVVDHLAGCETCYESFAAAVQFLDEDREAEGEEAEVLEPPAGRWRPRRWVVLPLAAAAGLALLLASPLLRGWRTPPAAVPAADFAALIATGGDLSRISPEGWTEARERWPRFRGPGAATTGEQAAARMGALAVDLETALADGNRAQGAVAAGLLASELDPELFLLSEDLQDAYRDLVDALEASSSEGSIAPADLERELLDLFTDSELRYYGLGKWAEAGRLAAAAGNLEYFRSARVRRLGDRLDAETYSPEVKKALFDALTDLRSGAPSLADAALHFGDLAAVAGGA
jgi:hypothetical protein